MQRNPLLLSLAAAVALGFGQVTGPALADGPGADRGGGPDERAMEPRNVGGGGGETRSSDKPDNDAGRDHDDVSIEDIRASPPGNQGHGSY